MTDNDIDKILDKIGKYCPGCGERDYDYDYSNFSQDNGSLTGHNKTFEGQFYTMITLVNLMSIYFKNTYIKNA